MTRFIESPLVDDRELTTHIARAFGGELNPETVTVGPEPIRIAWKRDSPVKGVTSYSTIGLSGHRMFGPEGEFPVRIELAGGCENDVEAFPYVLASAACCIRETPGVFYPGAIILNQIEEFEPFTPMKHLLLTMPFIWKDLVTLDYATIKVSWLLAIPISDSEYRYRRGQGDGALEKLFEEVRLDVFDFKRSPVV